MRSRIVILAVTAALGTAVPAVASAQDWRPVSESSAHVTAMDFARASGPRTRRLVWFVRTYAERNELLGDYTLMQYRINCDNQTMTRLAMGTYTASGASLDNITTTGEPETVFPESTGSSMVDAACGVEFPADPTWDSARSFAQAGRMYLRSLKD